MTTAQKIRMALAYRNMSEAELARSLGTTPQAFNQRMRTDRFSSDELQQIAKVLNALYKFSFIFDDGAEI